MPRPPTNARARLLLNHHFVVIDNLATRFVDSSQSREVIDVADLGITPPPDLTHALSTNILECRSHVQFAELPRFIGEEAQADEREAAAAGANQ